MDTQKGALMNRIASRKMVSKKIIVLTTLAILLLGLTAAYLYNRNTHSDTQKSKSTSGIADEIKRKAPEKNTSSKHSDDLPDDATSKTTDDIPVDPTLSIIISSTSQSEGQVKATAEASTSGTCVFQYETEGDKPVVVQSETSGNICSSSVPEVQFAKIGSWQLKLTFYSGGKKIEAIKDVTIN